MQNTRNAGFPRSAPHMAAKIPKVREYIQIKMTDGSVLNGYVFVEATTRIQDLLNSGTQFIPFIDEDDTILLLNKAAIAQARPYDT